MNSEEYSRLSEFLLTEIGARGSRERGERRRLGKGVLVENEDELAELEQRCWFGKSLFEVLLANVARLILRNEYYDAAKLNYLAGCGKGSLAEIGVMMLELRRTLESVGRKAEIRDEWLQESVAVCIEVLQKLNK